MAALRGFDVKSGVTVLVAPVVTGQLLASVALPAGYAVGGLDLTMPALDPSGPLLVTVGDPADTDRIMTGSSIGADGGTVEYRPDPTAWHRYAKATTVSVRVAIPPLASVSTGTVVLTLYTYPAVTLATARSMILEELGVLKEDGTARAEEAAQAGQALSETYDELRGPGLGNRIDLEWPVDLIPTWAVRQVAKIGAKKLMGVFGLPLPRRQMLQADAAMAEREMRRQTRKSSLLEPVQTVYY